MPNELAKHPNQRETLLNIRKEALIPPIAYVYFQKHFYSSLLKQLYVVKISFAKST